MLPIRIVLENFKGHKKTDIDCTLFKTALIVGRNKQNTNVSVGSGKTSLIESFEYALYGEISAKQLNAIVKNGEDKSCVIFEFEIDDAIFKIVRTRNSKHSKTEVRFYKKGTVDWIDLTCKTASETDEEILNVIKINHISFKNSIYFAQSDLNSLASISSEKRKALLKEPLQLSIYGKYEKIAKEKLNIISKNIEKNETIINALGQPENDIIELKEKLISTNDEEKQAKELLLKYNEEFNKISIELLSLKEKHTNNNRELLSNSLSKTLKDKEIENKILNDLLQSKLNIITSKNSNIKNLNIFQKELLSLNLEKENLDKIIISNIDEIKNKHTNLINKEIEGKTYLGKLKLDQKRLNKTITNETICSHCLQEVLPEYREQHEIKRIEELNKINLLIENTEKKLSDLIIQKNKYDKDIQLKIDTEIKKKELIFKIENRNIQIISIQKTLEEAEIKLNDIIEKILNIQNKIKELNTSETETKKQIEQSRESIIEEEIKNIEEKLFNTEKLKIEYENKLPTLNKIIGALDEKIKTKEEDIIKLNELLINMLEIKKMHMIYLKVVQTFGSSGCPLMIVNTILDDLQIRANDILKDLNSNMEIIFSTTKERNDGQIEEALEINFRVDSSERDFYQLSGGQKALINLALKLALSLIIQNRIGISIKFLVLDEVDASLDPSCIVSLATLIKKWSDKFKIFIISHNALMQSYFNNAILIEMDNNGSSFGKLINN